ncbi:MAG: FAD-dependent oxidoreductase [Sutterella wadsworthensis]
MKRNETSARGASKHAPVKNAGSRRLRSLTAAAFIVMTGIGLAWHTGWGTLSSFGIGSIAEVCPLGALEAMLADRTFLPQAFFGLLVVAAVVVLFGRIFCGWVCPVPLLRRITGMKDERPAEKAGACSSKTAACTPSACASCISGGKGDEVASTDGRTDADRAGRNPGTGPFWVLGGALASSAVFGFPVFCLICPVGLTFALVIALWRLFEFNEPSLSIVFFAGFLILELFVLRRWCHAFCPLGAVMTILARLNRTFRPAVKLEACAASAGIDCRVCRDACPEGLDPRGGNTPWTDARCTKCRACADACPTHAIHFPAFERKAAARAASSAGEGAVAVKVLLPPRVPEKAIPVEARRTTFAEGQGLSLKNAGGVEVLLAAVRRLPSRNDSRHDGPMAGRRVRQTSLVRSGAAPVSAVSSNVCGMCSVAPAPPLPSDSRARGRGCGAQKVRTLSAAVQKAPLRSWARSAGLACADMLARLGATVTVIDAHEEAGGLLAHGIPAFKLDGNVLEKRLSVLGKAGVAFRLGTRFDGRIVDEVLARHDAVFVATGAGRAVMPSFAAEVRTGFVDALAFLKENASGSGNKSTLAGQRAVVLGGGDTALDCARTAVRLGASETIVACRRGTEELRASRREVRHALEEGVVFMPHVTPVAAEADADGVLTGLVLENVETGERLSIGTTTAVVAFGQRCVRLERLAAEGVVYDESDRILVDAEGRTGVPKIWAGGDAVRGPALAVEAVADGRRVAFSIAETLGL